MSAPGKGQPSLYEQGITCLYEGIVNILERALLKIVFLDIDGVLNNRGTAIALGSTSEFLDPVSVALVDRLCEQADAHIVLSSSWRIGGVERVQADLQRLGAKCLADRIVAVTPDLRDPNATRGDEIAAWLEVGKPDRYVIIDDEGDMHPWQHLVQTTFEDGFRLRHYVAAMKILAPENPDCNIKASPI